MRAGIRVARPPQAAARAAARPVRVLDVAGLGASVAWRVSQRARRLTLSVDPTEGALRLTTPPGVPAAEVQRFLALNFGWMKRRLEQVPVPVPFADGAVVPLRGVPHRVRWVGGRTTVRAVEGELRVGGLPEHLARRVRDWLRAEARRAIVPQAAALAAQVERRPSAITVRDTKSRWGSCSAAGRLSFSWRLILAPPDVLTYIVAHEVAHLVHLDHSEKFWRLCERLHPTSTRERRWLKHNGADLHRYG